MFHNQSEALFYFCLHWLECDKKWPRGETDYEKLLSEHVMIPIEQGPLCEHVSSSVLLSLHH